MFSFLKRKDGIDIAAIVRRLVDVTTPNLPQSDEHRSERRFNRTLPIVITPLIGDSPKLDEACLAITHDLSDSGLGATTFEEITGDQYLVALWPPHEIYDEPLTFSCSKRCSRQVAIGLWATGFSIDRVMSIYHRSVIAKNTAVAARLLRPTAEQCAEPAH